MPRLRSAFAAVLVAVVTLAGCGGDDSTGTENSSDGGSESPSSSEASPSSSETATESESGEVPDLEVADVFGPATWGLEVEGEVQVVVTSEATVVADSETIRALGPDGEELWQAEVEAADPADSVAVTAADYPVLRRVDEDVIAYATAGTIEGDGLTEATAGVQVRLFGLQDGEEVASVDIPGGDSAPAIAEFGLVFSGADAEIVVAADGSTREVPDATGLQTVGDTLVRDDFTDLLFPTWKASDVAAPGFTGTPEIAATDGEDLVLLRWPLGNADPAALVRVSTGEVVARPECDVPEPVTWSSSPSGTLQAAGPLVIDGDEVTCVGGGEGEVSVSIAAITDEGQIFGTAYSASAAEGGGIAGSFEFVSITPEGEADRTELPAESGSPIGIMEGDVVVNLGVDSQSNTTITGNPIEQ